MAELTTKFLGLGMKLLFWIESLGFYFLDDAYNFLIRVTAGFNEAAIKEILEGIGKSAYVIVGIFALFKCAVSLITAIVNPEKLSDKEEGIGNVLIHVVGAIALFIAVPIIFDYSREIQKKVVTENYIPQVILGVELFNYELDADGNFVLDSEGNIKYNDNNNPGELLQLIIMKSAIKPNQNCNGQGVCGQAVQAYDDNLVRPGTVLKFLDKYEKVGDSYEFAYDYTPFILLVGGIFTTYIIISLTIDIAIRNVELLVLECHPFGWHLFYCIYVAPSARSWPARPAPDHVRRNVRGKN